MKRLKKFLEFWKILFLKIWVKIFLELFHTMKEKRSACQSTFEPCAKTSPSSQNWISSDPETNARQLVYKGKVASKLRLVGMHWKWLRNHFMTQWWHHMINDLNKFIVDSLTWFNWYACFDASFAKETYIIVYTDVEFKNFVLRF